MSNGDTNKILNLIKSRHPIIFVETHEELRVLNELVTQVWEDREDDDKQLVFTWDSANGLSIVKMVENILTRTTVTQEMVTRFADDYIETLEEGIEPPYRSPSQAIAFAKCFMGPSLFVFLDIHSFINAETSPDTIREFKDLAFTFTSEQAGYYKNIIFLSPVVLIPVELDKQIQLVTFSLPRPADLRIKLDSILADFKVDKILGDFSENFELTDEYKHGVCQAARGMTLSEFTEAINYSVVTEDVKIKVKVIQAAKESIIKKAGRLEFVKPVPLSELGGLDLLKEKMEMNKWALTKKAAKLGAGLSKGFLCIGYSGTGKSLAAKVASSVLGLPLLRLDMNKIFGGIVGQSESNIRAAWEIAKANAPCILHIDEIEKALSGLSSSDASDSGTTSRVISTLLTQMQETEEQILTFGTCNDWNTLPPEAKRRFDDIIFFDFPDNEARTEIMKIHLSKPRFDMKEKRDLTKFDIPLLVEKTKGYTGSEVEVVIKRGMIQGGFRRDTFNTEDIIIEINRYVPMVKREGQSEKLEKLRTEIKHVAEPASSKTLETEMKGLAKKLKGSKRIGSGIKAKKK